MGMTHIAVATCPSCGHTLDFKPVAIGNFIFYRDHITKDNSVIRLSRAKAAIFSQLAHRLNNVVSREALWLVMYGADPNGGCEAKIFDVYICKLRQDIKRMNLPFEIETVWGRGWALREKPL